MTSFNFTKSVLVVSLLLVILAFAGCSDDDDPVVGTEPRTIVVSPTADSLMENFIASTLEMKILELGDILHEDFKLIFSTYTIQDWGMAPGATMDREQMLRIHDNMFSGLAGSNEHGNTISPLDRIEISLFEREGIWTDADINDPLFSGSWQAMYNVRMFFHDNTGGHAFEVNQMMIFYAKPVGDYFYLKGIRPIYRKAVDAAYYDGTIYLYNTVPD